MISVLAVVAVMAALVAVSAMPAFANHLPKNETAPNCERGQFTAFVQKAFNKSVNDNPGKSFDKFLDCLSGNNF